jgi:hypothetical protein
VCSNPVQGMGIYPRLSLFALYTVEVEALRRADLQLRQSYQMWNRFTVS